MAQKKEMNKNLYQYSLVLFGGMLLIVFIWFRFLRERLPKMIPFQLSLLGFCLLLTTCGLFLYIIISLLREDKQDKPVDPLIKHITNSLYIPLETFDHYIKNLSYTNNTYKYGINFLAYLFGPLIINSTLFYYLFIIIPRLILLTTLYIDIFWFHKLYYIYKVLLIGILIFLGKYIIYSFKYAKECFMESFQPYVDIQMPYLYASQVVEVLSTEEEDEDYDIPTMMVVPLDVFIEFQTASFLQQQHYPYMSTLSRRNQPNKIPRDFSLEEIQTRITNLLKISLILSQYNVVHNSDLLKNLKILIYLNYFLCWSYILIASLPSLYYASFEALWVIQDIENPFSLTNTYAYENL
jgi:hypothetical protein